MSSGDALKWLERSLIAAGVVLGVWWLAAMTEGRYFQSLPAPPPPGAGVARPLPGEETVSEAPKEASTPQRLKAGDWLARLDAPTVHLSATILEGTDDSTLSRGAGHIEETAYPGEEGNLGIAGHRDTVFRPVRGLKIGDPLLLETADRTFEYRVVSTSIVEPTDVYVLDPTPRASITLVTCFPFTFVGHAPKRYIVRAEMVGTTARTS